MARRKKKKSFAAPLLILLVLVGAAAGIAFMRVDAERQNPVSKIMELFAPPTPDPALTLADFAPAGSGFSVASFCIWSRMDIRRRKNSLRLTKGWPS